jgi:hypothetical protein
LRSSTSYIISVIPPLAPDENGYLLNITPQMQCHRLTIRVVSEDEIAFIGTSASFQDGLFRIQYSQTQGIVSDFVLDSKNEIIVQQLYIWGNSTTSQIAIITECWT